MVAPRLAARGCEVAVIGGDPARMITVSPAAKWMQGSTMWQVMSALRRLGRFDVVHAHMTAAELGAVATKPFHGARLVATLHFASPRGSRRTGSPLPMLGRFLDEQIAISQFVAQSVRVSRVLPLGVEWADPGPSKRDRTVLVMQRLEAEKHTDAALRAWSGSGLRRRGWRLLIAGRGAELNELRRLAHDLRIDDSTEWLGFVDNPGDIVARTAVLLAPAPAEPFGMTVVEAMARATPVIAASGGAHLETLGPDAWVFPVGDVCACTRLLDRVDAEDVGAYGARLQTRQRELFDIDSHTDALMQVYEDVVST